MFPNAYVLLDFVTGHRGLFSYRFRGDAVRHGQHLGGHLCHLNNRFHPRVRVATVIRGRCSDWWSLRQHPHY